MAAAASRRSPIRTAWPHITLNANGAPCIDGTRFKAQTVVIDYIHNGRSLDEILTSYPHLTLAQIHAALTYYYDNRQAMDADIVRRRAESDRLLKDYGSPLPRAKLLDRARQSHDMPGENSDSAS